METLYTVEQVADKFDVHPNYIRKLARKGELQGRKIGRNWRFTDDDLKTFLESAKVSTENNVAH